MLQKKTVSWSELAQKDKEIEGYEAGLKLLKSYRAEFFPNWKDLTTQD